MHAVVQLGERFTVKVAAEANGMLDYPVPVPTNMDVIILGQKGAVITFRAISRGEVDLRASGTPFCPGTPTGPASCTVLIVNVT